MPSPKSSVVDDGEASALPKAGGVKAMLAKLNKNNPNSHVVLPDGSVLNQPQGKPRPSWKPPPKPSQGNAPDTDALPATKAAAPAVEVAPAPQKGPDVGGKQAGGIPGEQKPTQDVESQDDDKITPDEMLRVREQVLARRRSRLATTAKETETRPATPPNTDRERLPVQLASSPPVTHRRPMDTARQASSPSPRGILKNGGLSQSPSLARESGGTMPSPQRGASESDHQSERISQTPAGQERKQSEYPKLLPVVLGPPLPGTGPGRPNVLPETAILPPASLPDKTLPDGIFRGDVVYGELGKYSGVFKNKVRQGRGIFTFSNGDSYNGEWDQGYMHGYGEYTWKGGQTYAGDWDHGKQEGRGFMTWPSSGTLEAKTATGGRYTGSFSGGLRAGQGSETLHALGQYAGEWRSDKRSGIGTFSWTNGNIYDGEWKDDLRHGIGLFVWSGGRRFEGRFEKDYPREGLLCDTDGTSYAVTYDPQGVYEIERNPSPLEKTKVGRRDYTGPRYSSTPRTRLSAMPKTPMGDQNNYIPLSPSSKQGETEFFTMRHEISRNMIPIGPAATKSQENDDANKFKPAASFKTYFELNGNQRMIKQAPTQQILGQQHTGERGLQPEPQKLHPLNKDSAGLERRMVAGADAVYPTLLASQSEHYSSSLVPQILSAVCSSEVKSAQPRGELGLAVVRVPKGLIVGDKKLGSPASYSQKLRVGDQLVKVDGVRVEHMDVIEVRKLLTGAPYTCVDLELISSDTGESYSCALQRVEATDWSAQDPIRTMQRQANLGQESLGVANHGAMPPDDFAMHHAKSLSSGSLLTIGSRVSSAPPLKPGFSPMHLAIDRTESQARALPVSQAGQQSSIKDMNPELPVYETSVITKTNHSAPPMSPPVNANVSQSQPRLMQQIGLDLNMHSEQNVTAAKKHQAIGILLARHVSRGDPSSVIVEGILPGSCATLSEPEIMKGDELIAINSELVQSMTLESLHRMIKTFVSSGNKQLTLILRRNGIRFETVLHIDPPEPLIPDQVIQTGPTRGTAPHLGPPTTAILPQGSEPFGHANSVDHKRQPSSERSQMASRALFPDSNSTKVADSDQPLNNPVPTPRVTPEHQLEPYQKSLAPADHEQRNVQVKLVPETNVIGQPSHRVVRTEHQSIGLLLKRVSSVPGSAYITSIQPGTLADISGKIRVGDNLVAINGQKVDQLSLSDIHDLMTQREIKMVRLVLMRESQPIQVDLFRESHDDLIVVQDQAKINEKQPVPQRSLSPVQESHNDLLTVQEERQARSLHWSQNYRDHVVAKQEEVQVRSPQPSRSVTDVQHQQNVRSFDPLGLRSLITAPERPAIIADQDLKGIGLRLERQPSGQVVIEDIKPDSNADKARVFAKGDQVLAVGEESVVDKSLDFVRSRILGKPGTTVLLTMLRAHDGNIYTMVVVREGGVISSIATPREYAYPSPPSKASKSYQLVGQPSSGHTAAYTYAYPNQQGMLEHTLHKDIQPESKKRVDEQVPSLVEPNSFPYSLNQSTLQNDSNLDDVSPVRIVDPPGYNSPGHFESVLMGTSLFSDSTSKSAALPIAQHAQRHTSAGLGHTIAAPHNPHGPGLRSNVRTDLPIGSDFGFFRRITADGLNSKYSYHEEIHLGEGEVLA